MSALDAEFEEVLRHHLKYLEPGGDLQPQAALADLGLDSMQAVDLLFDLEDRFGVTLPDAALTAETFATAASLQAAVEQARQGVGAR
jgi:acyl carrier protein